MSNDIYLDKIRLGALIVEKELSLIEIFNQLLHDIRLRPEILDFINDYPVYHECWRCLCELYDFLEHDYASKLSKKEKERIKTIVASYRDLKELKLMDLKVSVAIVRKIMSLSKFHDVIRKIDQSSGLDKINKRYKLKDGE